MAVINDNDIGHALSGTIGPDTIHGNGGDDTITAGSGVNAITGDAGNDQIIFQGGTLVAGNRVDGGSGIDLLDFSKLADGSSISVDLFVTTGQDIQSGRQETITGIDNLTGTQFADTLFGSDSANVINGGDGNDVIRGTDQFRVVSGSDTLGGGEGDDTIFAPGSLNISIDGGAGNDRIIFDNNGFDPSQMPSGIIDGGAGTDSLVGSGVDFSNTVLSGIDVLETGFQGTSLTVDQINSIGRFEVDDDNPAMPYRLNVVSAGSVDFSAIAPHGVFATAAVANVDLAGSAVDDILTALAADTIDGGSGNDIIDLGAAVGAVGYGSGGNDIFRAGGVAQTVDGGAGSDTLMAAPSSDATSSRLDISGLSISNIETLVVDGFVYMDTSQVALFQHIQPTTPAVFANIELYGSGTADFSSNAPGGLSVSITNDAQSAAFNIKTGTGIDYVTGGKGDDTISDLGGQNGLDGAEGNDRIVAGNGDDSLIGGFGNDTLIGNGGNDTLYVGSGLDHAYGGTGNDLVIFTDGAIAEGTIIDGGDGSDTIAAYTALSTVSLVSVEVLETELGGVELRSDQVSQFSTIKTAVFDSHDVQITLVTGGAANFSQNAKIDVVVTGSSFGNVITTGIGSDSLIGGAGDDTLNGGALVDTMTGGAGNDTFIVDNSGDKVFEAAGEGADTIFASASFTLGAGQSIEVLGTTSVAGAAPLNLYGNELDQLINGNNGDNQLLGLGGNDTLYGFGGHNKLYGGAGDDVLVSNGGSDALSGGIGNDLYRIDSSNDLVTEVAGQGADTIQVSFSYALAAGASIEALSTTDGSGAAAIKLIGNELAQTLTGNAGNNLLNGGTGADTMTGLAGKDTYIVDNAADRVIEAAGGGADTVFTSVSYGLSAGQEVEVLGTTSVAGTGALTLIGNEFGQMINGNAGDNTLLGLDGNDTVRGYGGSNRLYGGAGDDILISNGGHDTLSGAVGNDTYLIDSANDVVQEAAGAGTDTVFTSTSYTLAAGLAVETLATSSIVGIAPLSLTGNEQAQRINGNAGNNILTGGGGSDTMFGNDGNDTLTGQGGRDVLYGGNGSDALHASSGPIAAGSVYDGGGSDDTLYAGQSSVADLTHSTIHDVENLVTTAGVILTQQQFNGFTGHIQGPVTIATAGSLDVAQGSSQFDLTLAPGGNAVTFDRNAVAHSVSGGAGADSIIVDETAHVPIISGGGGNDVIVAGTGPSTIMGGDGRDQMTYEAGLLDGTQIFDGGAGYDSVVIDAFEHEDGATITIDPRLLSNVEDIDLESSVSLITYDITISDAMVRAGDFFYVHVLYSDTIVHFDGSAETDGSFYIYLRGGNSTFAGGALGDFAQGAYGSTLDGRAGDDTLDGGSTVHGGAGNDLIYVGPGYGLILDGGEGTDTLSYARSAGDSGFAVDLRITGYQDVVGGGPELISGIENLVGSPQPDRLTGDQFANVLTGGRYDRLDGGGGGDTYAFAHVADSTSQGRDTVVDANFASDKLDFGVTPAAIAPPVTHGALSTYSFDDDLSAAVGAGQLSAGQAVLFDPDGGDLNGAGYVFLIVDANGVAGYQAGQDYVVELENPTGTLTVENFI